MLTSSISISPCWFCHHSSRCGHRAGKQTWACGLQRDCDRHYCTGWKWSIRWCWWYAGRHCPLSLSLRSLPGRVPQTTPRSIGTWGPRWPGQWYRRREVGSWRPRGCTGIWSHQSLSLSALQRSPWPNVRQGKQKRCDHTTLRSKDCLCLILDTISG